MECPWCWEDVREEDAVMSVKNGLLYHDDCLDAFNDVVSPAVTSTSGDQESAGDSKMQVIENKDEA